MYIVTVQCFLSYLVMFAEIVADRPNSRLPVGV